VLVISATLSARKVDLDLVIVAMPFMYIKKSRPDSELPRGCPLLNGCGSENETPFSTTMVRSSK